MCLWVRVVLEQKGPVAVDLSATTWKDKQDASDFLFAVAGCGMASKVGSLKVSLSNEQAQPVGYDPTNDPTNIDAASGGRFRTISPICISLVRSLSRDSA